MSCGVAGFTVFTARRIAGGIRYRNYFRPSACTISPSSCTSHSLSVKEAENFSAATAAVVGVFADFQLEINSV